MQTSCCMLLLGIFVLSQASAHIVQLRRADLWSHQENLQALSSHQANLLSPWISLAESTSKQGRDAVADLKQFRNTQYLGQITVGGQELQVIFDTGSSHLFVNSDKCRHHFCLTRTRYSSSRSPDYSPLGRDIRIAYGQGILEGSLGVDTVEIGGVTVKNQVIAEIIKPSKNFFAGAYFDGIVGLALPGLSQDGTLPLYENLLSQFKTNQQSFNFFFDRIGNFSKSMFSLGDPMPSFFEGNLRYYAVIGDKYWEVRLQNIYLGDKKTDLCVHGCTAVLDTGSSLISGPSTAIYKLLKSLNFDPNNCKEALSSLPSISFEFSDGYKYTLTPQDYLLGSLKPTPRDSDAGFSPSQLESCIAGFSALNIPSRAGYSSATWVLGDLFLSKYYLSFDRKALRVGIGQVKRGPRMEERVKMAQKSRQLAKQVTLL